MKVSEVLYGAADWIDRHGWFGASGTVGGGGSAKAAACASNAISWTGKDGWGPAHKVFISYLGDGDGPTAIFNWNDAPERTQHEVTAALRACALIEAAKEAAAEQVAQDAAPAGVGA